MDGRSGAATQGRGAGRDGLRDQAAAGRRHAGSRDGGRGQGRLAARRRGLRRPQRHGCGRQAGLGYVLGVTSQFSCGWSSAQETLDALGPDIWTRLSAGEGSKGERLFDWALVHEWPQAEAEGWTRKLVARRLIRDPEDIHFFVVRCPAAMSLEDIARLAGRRWIIEECFRTAKQKAGLARAPNPGYRVDTLRMAAR
jgi:hypothetical protein